MKVKYITYNFIKVTLLFITCIHSFGVKAQMQWNQAYQNYINQYKDLAVQQMLRYHIPASITLAQGVFESRAGMSDLTRNFNNHFGIKCHNYWTGATTYKTDDAENECFRAYNNAYESYEDHSKFLCQSPRYSCLFKLGRRDYRGWAYGLKNCGYATNPSYADKLIQIIELYHLNDFDSDNNYNHFVERHNSRDISFNGVLHSIKIFNDNYYLIAREGDTFKSIGKEVDISWRKLARYNERDKHDILQAGDIVFLKKKRSKAPKVFKNRPHIVQPGESMYLIAQMYGIRLKDLYKMNKLSPVYQIYSGAKLRVR